MLRSRWIAATGATFASAIAYHQRESIAQLLGIQDKSKKELPAHHDPCGKGFVNPWPSFIRHGSWSLLKMFVEFDHKQSKVTEQTPLPKILAVDRPLLESLSQPQQGTDQELRHDKVATTWLGQ
ncbi:unnamed protein product [Mortierella alpina]